MAVFSGPSVFQLEGLVGRSPVVDSRFRLASRPVPGFARRVRDSDHHNLIQMPTIDDLERETTKQEKAVAVVAVGESLRIRRNRVQGPLELGLELLGGVGASFRVPEECIRVVPLRCGRYDNVSHRGPLCDGIEYGHPTRKKLTCVLRRFLRNVAETPQPKPHSAVPIRPVTSCPTRRRSAAPFPRRGGFAQRPGFLEGWSYFKSNTVHPASQP